jgi:hypothetical protein
VTAWRSTEFEPAYGAREIESLSSYERKSSVSEARPGYAHPIGVSVGDMTPPEALGEKAR